MRILVTGGAGYIGSHIVHALCDAGHIVDIVDNFSTGLEVNLDKRIRRLIRGDILAPDVLKSAFSEPLDAVFHFAAWKAAGESMENPFKYARNNIAGSIALLEQVVNTNVAYFIFSSTAAVYGSPGYLPIDEEHPLRPENYYGYSKKAIEENLAWFSQLKGLRYAALRYFNATGYDVLGRVKGLEQNPANLSPIIMETLTEKRKAMTVFGDDYPTSDGSGVRDYIHVSDLATAHTKALDYLQNNDENLIVNLGTGRGFSVFEAIAAAEEVTGRKVPYQIGARRPGDPAELYASGQKAKELLDWEPKHSDLHTIFSTMLNVYKKQENS
jgi:UDP-glucose 4-epimerase